MLIPVYSNIKNSTHYKNELEFAVKLYNKKQHSELKFKSPYQVIKHPLPSAYPWTFINNKQQNFSYDKNKRKLDLNINNIKKKLKTLQPVRILVPRPVLIKSYFHSSYSSQVYFIYLIKRPYLSSEQITIKLIDKKGSVLRKSFPMSDCKIISYKYVKSLKVVKVQKQQDNKLKIFIEGNVKR